MTPLTLDELLMCLGHIRSYLPNTECRLKAPPIYVKVNGELFPLIDGSFSVKDEKLILSMDDSYTSEEQGPDETKSKFLQAFNQLILVGISQAQKQGISYPAFSSLHKITFTPYRTIQTILTDEEVEAFKTDVNRLIEDVNQLILGLIPLLGNEKTHRIKDANLTVKLKELVALKAGLEHLAWGITKEGEF